MNWFIVFGGLATIGAGVYQSIWKSSTKSWPTYLVGLTLVITAGPLSAQISRIDLGTDGLKIEVRELDTKQLGDDATRLVFEETTTIVSANSSRDISESEAQQAIQPYVDYVKGFDFIPLSYGGGSPIEVGAIVKFVDGALVLVASGSDALDSYSPIRTFAADGQFDQKVETLQTNLIAEFSCAQPYVESLGGLSIASSVNPAIASYLDKNSEYYIVTTVLYCTKSQLNFDMGALSEDNQDASVSAVNLMADNPIAVGYKINSLSLR